MQTICGIAVDSLAPPPPPPPPAAAADTTPPQTKIAKGPGKKLAKGKAKFSFSSSEPGSSFACKLDKKKPAPCRSPKTYSGLKPGRHTFKRLGDRRRRQQRPDAGQAQLHRSRPARQPGSRPGAAPLSPSPSGRTRIAPSPLA